MPDTLPPWLLMMGRDPVFIGYSADRCVGGIASASSVNGGFVAANAFDDVVAYSNEWQATSGAPQWITYQHVDAYNIRQVRTQWSYNGNKAYTLQYSDDGITFFNAGDTGIFSSSHGTWHEHEFSDFGNHIYWRLLITIYTGSVVVVITEIEMKEAVYS